MIKVTVFYPNGDKVKFDGDYYVDKHVPLAIERLGQAVKGVLVETGVSGGQSDQHAPFVAAFHAIFESVDAFNQAFEPHSKELFDDIPNYTNIQPIFQISEVRVLRFLPEIAYCLEAITGATTFKESL